MRFQPGQARSAHRNPGSDSHFDARPSRRFDSDTHGDIIGAKHGNAQFDADIDSYRDAQDPRTAFRA